MTTLTNDPLHRACERVQNANRELRAAEADLEASAHGLEAARRRLARAQETGTATLEDAERAQAARSQVTHARSVVEHFERTKNEANEDLALIVLAARGMDPCGDRPAAKRTERPRPALRVVKGGAP